MKDVQNIPAAKIKMMKGSIRCLVFGLLGLLPIIGVPFALAALWVSGRARAQEKHFWNAARTHRRIGLFCAAVGAVIWTIVDTLLIFHAIYIYTSA